MAKGPPRWFVVAAWHVHRWNVILGEGALGSAESRSAQIHWGFSIRL
jgi:hypothetical protein